MEIDILGPLDIRGRDRAEIRLPAGRERSLFALLLINRGDVVSVDRILEALWGSAPPGTAIKAVQGYVSHLRRVLEPEGQPVDARSLIVTRPPGYALRTDAFDLDATRFERLAGDGRRALEDGSPAEAARLLDEALALWRGPALAEFAYDDFARDEISRLEQLRLSAMEDRIDALLRLGRHTELADQLDAVVAANPLRERLRGQWILALYRCGRQADALDAYRDGRRLLASELGLEPGPELQRLERSILEQDPALEAPAPAPPPPRAESGQAPPARPPAGIRRGRWVAAGGVALLLVLTAVVVAVVLNRDEAPAAVKVIAPAVVAVDASTNRIVASIPAGSAPVAIASGAGAIWVGDAQDGTVTRVDPVTHATKPIGIGAPAIGLATGLGGIWVATGSFGQVVRIDPRLRRITNRFDFGTPGNPFVPTVSSVGVGDGQVWAGTLDGVARIDPRTGRILARADLAANALETRVGGGAVWVTLQTQRATRVDASSARPTTELYVGTPVLGIALARSAVWVGGGYGGQLWQADPVTAAQRLTTRAGHGSNAVALGAGSVWVASWSDHALIRVDPATGDVLATIPLGGDPSDIVVRDGVVWAAVQPT